MKAGPAGVSLASPLQLTIFVDRASVCSCTRRRTGLVSTRCTEIASKKPGEMRATRNTSDMSVPRPGPSSISRAGAGEPAMRQASLTQTPRSSPNIWLISGAVVKSPSAPNGSRVM